MIEMGLRLTSGLTRRFRRAWLKLRGVRITGACWVQAIELPRNPWDIALDGCALDRGVVLLTTGKRQDEPRIVIHAGVYINRYTILDASEKIEIGPNTMIGPHGYLTDHDHGTRADEPVARQALVGSPVRIGRDVWLGAHVVVLKGVTIGDGAVVGAGAVVTKDVAPGSVVAGVPARVIGARS